MYVYNVCGGGGGGGMVRSVQFTPDSYIYLLLHGSCIFLPFLLQSIVQC